MMSLVQQLFGFAIIMMAFRAGIAVEQANEMYRAGESDGGMGLLGLGLFIFAATLHWVMTLISIAALSRSSG